MRGAIYSRVSAKDSPKDADQEIQQMQAMAFQNGCKTVRVYRDSIAIPGAEQPDYRQMLLDAKQHHFDVLYFWALKQLSHQNATRTMTLLHQLSRWGIEFFSYTEPHLNSCHASKEVVTSIIATLLQQDSVYIGEQTRKGLERQRKTHKRGPKGQLGPGRPPVKFDQEVVRNLRSGSKPMSYGAIASLCGVSKATIYRFFQEIEAAKKEA